MMMRVITFIFLSTLSQWLWAEDISDFSANYLVKLNGIQAGELKRSLSTNSDGTRHFSSRSSAKGMFAFFKPDVVEENSTFKFDGKRVVPLSYRYQRTGGKKDKYLSLDFDWAEQSERVAIDDKKHPWTLKVKPDTLDKLVYQIALMHDLSTNKTMFSYQIADGGKVKTYDIERLGTEVITTPLGDIEAVKLIRHRDKKSERQTVLWCAPKLNYLPIKLEHKEKGGARFTAVLRRLKGIDLTPAILPPPPETTDNSPFGN